MRVHANAMLLDPVPVCRLRMEADINRATRTRTLPPHFRGISSQFSLLFYSLAGRHRHLVEQRVELRPYVIPFRTCNVAVGAFLDRPDFGSGRLGLMVVEVVIAPAIGSLISLGVLHSHIRSVEGAREESFPRWRGSRTVRVS